MAHLSRWLASSGRSATARASARGSYAAALAGIFIVSTIDTRGTPEDENSKNSSNSSSRRGWNGRNSAAASLDSGWWRRGAALCQEGAKTSERTNIKGVLKIATSPATTAAAGPEEASRSSPQSSSSDATEGAAAADDAAPSSVGVFLTPQSIAELQKRFPQAFSSGSSSDGQGVGEVILQLNPDDGHLQMYGPLLGSKATVQVLGIGEGALGGAAVEGAGGEGKVIGLHAEVCFKVEDQEKASEGGPKAPDGDKPVVESDTHVPTIALSTGGAAGDKTQSVALLLRLKQQGAMDNKEFVGYLPELTLEGRVFPAEVGRYTALPDPPLLLEGLFCTEEGFDQEGQSCREDAAQECAFCRFMKAGPCRDQFLAFERCAKDKRFDSSKAVDEEEKERMAAAMVEECSPAAAVLHRCMNDTPEYHASITVQREEGEGEGEEKGEGGGADVEE